LPFTSQAQRRLAYAAAGKKGGAGNMSQEAAKGLVEEDKPGKLPERVGDGADKRTKRQKALYKKRT
jgi:hypothetical protein